MSSACPFHTAPEASATQAPAAVPLSTRLKTQTQPMHDEAEHHGFHAALFSGGQRTLDAYTRMLAQQLSVQSVYEPLVRHAAAAGALRGLVNDTHFHLAALRADLAYFAIPIAATAPTPATLAMGDFIAACAAGDGAALIGVFYVFEGSTNGGTIIAKRVRDALRLETEDGTRFVNPHGPLVRQRWAEFKAKLDAARFDEPTRQRIIDAAAATFRLTHAMLSDLASQLPGVTIPARAAIAAR